VTDTLDRLTAALADRYRIERELGQGGMATVYLGHDLRHGRDVAIKVLHPDLGAALGGERFLTEIRTTARLQHPHILPLLDSGAADTFLYYVMPYVRGETLRTRLERERQLPLEDALRIAREVADALGAAHALGIIHRDIKPENILLQGGHALVADFGIALAVQQAAGQRMTQTGLSLGTPQYMSPEQAMGEKTLDARSDLYALGAVTYEMLVGEPPFTGPTVQTIVAKVLTERPTAPRALRDTVPAGVEQAVLKALAKLPADRFATAEKFAEALTRTDAVTLTEPVRPVAARRSLARIAGALGVLLLTAAIAWWLGRRSAAPEPPWSTFTQLTDAAGVETSPSLSPDGESFAYASNARGSSDIFVQRVGGRNPVLVAGDTAVDEVWPAYSPDGRQIAYNHKGGGIFVAGATGESARRITTYGSYPAWSPDGTQLVFSSEEVETPYNTLGTGRLWTVGLSGKEPSEVTIDRSDVRDFGVYQPAWSPGGARIVYWVNAGGQRDLETVTASGGPPVKLTDDIALDWAPIWSPDGKFVYFASDRGGAMGLWRIAVDEGSGLPRGNPEPIATGVDVDMDLPHLSRDGRTLIFRSKVESVNPAAVAFDPASARIGVATLLQHRSGVLAPTDMSPDGKWLALVNVPDRRQDLFLMRPDGSGLTRLTDDEARDWSPRFTPDGSGLVFFSNPGNKYEAWSIRLDGSGRTQLSDVASGIAFAMFAPDGKQLAVGRIPTGALIGSPPWPLTEKTAKALLLEVDGGALQPTFWSRDGRWLSGYVVSSTGEPTGFGIYEVATGQTRRLNSDSRQFDLAWLPGARVVYFTSKGGLVIQDVVSLERREISGALPYPPDILGSIVASPDGRTLYYGARQIEANIWLVKRPAPASP
jgi:serine/threonine protein kinase/Tol biopolymer transport system component